MAGKKRVTMQDIADRLNISKNSVSLALMNRKGVGEGLRRQIVRTAEEMGYQARQTRNRRAKNILVLVPEWAMHERDNQHFAFYHDLIWGLEKQARQFGCQAIIAPVDKAMERDLQLPGIAAEIPFAGTVLIGVVARAYARKAAELRQPLLMFDAYYRDIRCASVTAANVEGAYEAVAHLIARGHTRIGYIGAVSMTTSMSERWYGYLQAMAEFGLPADPAISRIRSDGYNVNAAEIETFIEGLERLPTAFFCGNDLIALSMISVLRSRGLRVLEDVSVVGFDDVEAAALSEPALTTVKVDKPAMCEAALTMLSLSADFGSHAERFHCRIPGRLIVRGTVAAPVG